MFQRKLMIKQIENQGVRIGDSCRIFPFQGKRKSFTLNRHRIDLVSTKFRPQDLSHAYIELPFLGLGSFHYRLELDHANDSGRFILKTLMGHPFWLNGTAVKEAYVERLDKLYVDDNRINFNPFDLGKIIDLEFEHPILFEHGLLESELRILIIGETGTGKTHLASKIHEKSGRSGNFVAINLSSYNPHLIESELFGHKKGSFTGAVTDKKGAFEEAEYGTLFLDEIDSLPLDLQTKLLTFLDNNKFRRVGDTKETLIKTRIIFAAGKSLEELVKQEKLRRDFYYRLKSGHTVELSSLRNETKRIKEACQYFALKSGISFSQRLLDFYETLAWPGNLRQLFGHLEKKKILSRSSKLDFDEHDEELLLQSSDLMSLANPSDLLPIEEMKQDYVKRAYSVCNGNLAMTARKLRVAERTIRNILMKSS